MNGKKVVAWIQLVLGALLFIGGIVAAVLMHSGFTERANKELKDIRTFYDTTQLSISNAEKTFRFNRDQDIVSQLYYTKIIVIYTSLITWSIGSLLMLTHGITSLNEY